MDAGSVALREVTADTVRAICALRTTPSQQAFVAENAVSLAQALFEPTATFRAIHADDQPVGFLMWRPGAEPGDVSLWRFMIDGRHQGRSIGRAALGALASLLRAQGATRLTLSYVAGEGGPRGFYEKLGFLDTGKRHFNGERLMTLDL